MFLGLSLVFDECNDPANNLCDAASGATCENLDNGYKCVCGTGHMISSDGLFCERKSPFPSTNHCVT